MVKTLDFLANGTIRLVGPNVRPDCVRTFVVMFQKTWLLLPEVERGELEEYWKTRDAPEGCHDRWQGLCEHQPCITLTTGSATRSLPLCTQAGHVLIFSVDVLKEMGDDFALIAIAHELAHAVLYGRAEKSHWADPRTTEACEATERAVDDLLRSWGVDQTDLVRWSRKWEEKEPF